MRKFIIPILLLSSAAAFANEAADERANRAAFSGSMSGADVRADMARARAEGTLRFDEYAGSHQKANGIGRNRTELRSEAIQASRIRVIHEQL